MRMQQWDCPVCPPCWMDGRWHAGSGQGPPAGSGSPRGRQIRLRERGQTTLLPCHCSFGAKERACVLLYWSVQTYERIAAIDRTTGGTDGGAAQCSCRRPRRLLPWNNNTVRVYVDAIRWAHVASSHPPSRRHHLVITGHQVLHILLPSSQQQTPLPSPVPILCVYCSPSPRARDSRGGLWLAGCGGGAA